MITSIEAFDEHCKTKGCIVFEIKHPCVQRQIVCPNGYTFLVALKPKENESLSTGKSLFIFKLRNLGHVVYVNNLHDFRNLIQVIAKQLRVLQKKALG